MDFDGTSEVVQFTAAGVQCVDIPINQDGVLEEEEEQFSVVLTTTDDAITIGRQVATVTIIDSEGMCCFVCFICSILEKPSELRLGACSQIHMLFNKMKYHILQGAM